MERTAATIVRHIEQLDDSKWPDLQAVVEKALRKGAKPAAIESRMGKLVRDKTGVIQRRKSRDHGVWVTVAEAEKSGFDPDGGDYITLCEEHSTVCNHATLRDALGWAPTLGWCEDCTGKRQG